MTSSCALHIPEKIFDPFCDNTIDKEDINIIKVMQDACRYITLGGLSIINGNICDFSYLHINCRSIRKNYSSIVNLLCNIAHQPLAIAITETWLEKGEEIYFTLSGYDFVSIPRAQGRGVV